MALTLFHFIPHFLMFEDNPGVIVRIYHAMTIQGMTFYDFIGKLAPGIILWAPFIPPDLPPDLNVLQWTLAFVVFYITGITWSEFINFSLRKARLCECMLRRSRLKGSLNPPDNVSEIRNTHSRETTKEQYIDAYYNIQSNNMLGSIPILESHENFLKTIWLLAPYWLVKMILREEYHNQSSTVIMVALTIAIIAIPLLWYNIQMKIYSLVWEADHYINLSKNK